MIVCSCNIVSRKEIEQVIIDFLTADEWQLITPGKVFQAMSARGKCCGRMPGNLKPNSPCSAISANRNTAN